MTYANRLPDDLADRQVFVLDPMLATGGPSSPQSSTSLSAARRDGRDGRVPHRGARGHRRRGAAFEGRAEVTVVVATVEERVREVGHTVPGLGDAGDRLCGVID